MDLTMKPVILYVLTAVIFLGLDAVGLKLLLKPLFERHIGALMLDDFRVAPAAVFYLGYIVGVLWFAAWPALKAGDPTMAALNGALLGLIAYGTYEFSNYAVLRDWSFEQVAVDTLWGGFLTGFSAWAGVVATRAVTGG